jgi:predicted ATPase
MVKSIDQYNRLARLSYNVYQEIRKDFLNIKYIGPIRKIAERSYSIAEVVKDIGFCGEHAAQILALRDERLLQNKVEKWFQQLDVADKMQIYIRDKTQQGSFELKIKTRNSKLGVNYRDVGCGTSQILPIIVQSLMDKNESLVILEQPEAHLHPKAQAELADFFIKTASENKRFLIETHSDYLIERLRYYVANKQLRPEDLFIYYVGQNPTSASAEVSRIQISSDGQYLNLPDDYITKFRFIEMQNITKKTLQNLKEKENKYMKK